MQQATVITDNDTPPNDGINDRGNSELSSANLIQFAELPFKTIS